MSILERLEADFVEFAKDLQIAEQAYRTLQDRYAITPLAGTYVMAIEAFFEVEGLRNEIGLIQAKIQNYKDENGLDYETEQKRVAYQRANGKPSL